MKHIRFKVFASTLLIMAMLMTATSCGKKNVDAKKSVSSPDENYSFSGKNPDFTASVVEEKDADGNLVSYFVLNNYKVEFKTKDEAIAHFNELKKSWETAEAEDGEGMGALSIMYEMENLDLHTVREAGGIRYVNLEGAPNYADVDGPSYASMSTDDLLAEYENTGYTAMLVIQELSSRNLTPQQERRVNQIAENLANMFGEDW
ncbi:MAG: hypothetical protein IKQ43_08605 [Treponema sp.]|nr:hypothetical protein [Treponema sp.]